MARPDIVEESALASNVVRIDAFESALRELFFIEHPDIKKTEPAVEKKVHEFIAASQTSAVWVYFSKKNVAVRIPDESVYFRLLTARNRNLITAEEQRLFRSARVGIAGLSVGSTALATLVATGGPKYLKIADPDVLEITNLNRLRATVLDIHSNKTEIAAQNAWEVDPFLEIEAWSSGIQRESLQQFLLEPRLDVFVDEMDSIDMKIAARYACRDAEIPIVMATDNGDSVIVDIERFDEEEGRSIFHGRVNISEAEARSLDRDGFIKLSNQIIDTVLFTPRQWESIQQIGKTLSGVPQMATAASIAGAAVAWAIRMITTQQPLQSGRYVLGCDFLTSV